MHFEIEFAADIQCVAEVDPVGSDDEELPAAFFAGEDLPRFGRGASFRVDMRDFQLHNRCVGHVVPFVLIVLLVEELF